MNIFTFFIRKLKQKLFRVPLYKLKFNIKNINKSSDIPFIINDNKNKLIIICHERQRLDTNIYKNSHKDIGNTDSIDFNNLKWSEKITE